MSNHYAYVSSGKLQSSDTNFLSFWRRNTVEGTYKTKSLK